jgi:GT2 family glycosyltransferase
VTGTDVVIVSYNSRRHLRDCIGPLVPLEGVNVIVVDNASSDGCLTTVADLAITVVAREDNGGFAVGCNAGWRRGTSPHVLFLNPDTELSGPALETLRRVLETDASVGIVAPRTVNAGGSLEFSVRRFPRLRSTYAQALFLHRLLPRASWADEVERDPSAYDRTRAIDWASGACLLVRRTLLERLGGFDERFFMYCDDIDLCKRCSQLGFEVRYEPAATVMHAGGQSAPRPSLLAVLAESRRAYSRKHDRRPASRLMNVGIALGAVTHVFAGRGTARRGQLAVLRVMLGGRASPPAKSQAS